MADDKKYKVGGRELDWEELKEWAEEYLRNPPPDRGGEKLSLNEYFARLFDYADNYQFEEAMKREVLEIYLKAKAIQDGREPEDILIPEELKTNDPRTPDSFM
tara:strand:+ start:166 stop:474 length:309 start_codon:yes stop_codon:yes gene_type:complete